MPSRALITPLALLIAIVSAWFAYDAHRDPRTWVEKFDYRYAMVNTKTDELENIIQDGASASNFLASFTRDLFIKKQGDQVDSVFKDPTLISLLNSLAKAHPKLVMQIRLLDAKGRERIRFNNSIFGETTQASDQDLQDKSDRDYFKISSSSPNGLTITSPIELNIENGIIEKPDRPTVRFITPIKVNNEHVAHVVLNYDFSAILYQLEKHIPKNLGLLIANKDGSWVRAPNQYDNWNKELQNSNVIGLDQYAPKLFEDLHAAQEYEVMSEKVDGRELYMKNVRAPFIYRSDGNYESTRTEIRGFFIGISFPEM